MAKEKNQRMEEPVAQKEEMTAEEAKAFRASLYKTPVRVFTEKERREIIRFLDSSQKTIWVLKKN